MQIEYYLSEEDMLAFQLYAASKSDRIRKRKLTTWMLFTLSSLALGMMFYLQRNTVSAWYFFIIAVVCLLFYPLYFKWRYKRHYKSFIRENYKKRAGTPVYFELHTDYIATRGMEGESKILLKEVELVVETTGHFFIRLSTGVGIVIPKHASFDVVQLRKALEEKGLDLRQEPDWKW